MKRTLFSLFKFEFHNDLLCFLIASFIHSQRHHQPKKVTVKRLRHLWTLLCRHRLNSRGAVSSNSCQKATSNCVESQTIRVPSSVKSSALNTYADGRHIISTSMTPKSHLKRYVRTSSSASSSSSFHCFPLFNCAKAYARTVRYATNHLLGLQRRPFIYP